MARLAFRNLARNRRRTAFALAALVVGVGAMVSFRGFINGVQRMFVENVVDGSLGAVQVHRTGYLANIHGSPLQLDMEDTAALREKLRTTPGVAGVSPRISFGAMFSTPDDVVEGREPTDDELGQTAFLMAVAFDPAAEREVSPRRWAWLDRGRVFETADAPEVLLNADLAKSLELEALPDRSSWPPDVRRPAVLAADRDGTLNGEAVVLTGTVKSVMPGDKRQAFLPLATAQRLLRMDGRVTEYAIGVKDLSGADEVRDRLAAALGPAYEVHTWDQVLPFVREILGHQDTLFGMMSSVFLIVVLLGIVNVMLMNVLERVREIGTMLAVGTRRRQIVTLFVLEGATLGALGGALGVLLGSAIVLFLHHRGIPLSAPGAATESIVRPFIEPAFLGRAVVLATIGAALAALWPAYRAAKLRPVEALQTA